MGQAAGLMVGLMAKEGVEREGVAREAARQ